MRVGRPSAEANCSTHQIISATERRLGARTHERRRLRTRGHIDVGHDPDVANGVTLPAVGDVARWPFGTQIMGARLFGARGSGRNPCRSIPSRREVAVAPLPTSVLARVVAPRTAHRGRGAFGVRAFRDPVSVVARPYARCGAHSGR